MNKLLKYTLGLLTAFTLSITSFSSAYFECDKSYISSQGMSNGQTWSQNLGNGFADVGGDIFCIVGTETSFSVSEQCDGNYDITVGVRESYCITAAESTSNLCFKSNGRGLVGWYWFDTSCLTQPYTSLVCQTKYNLIPIEEVTANYCRLNFDLISPLECPSGGGSGTGAVNRSAWYINNQQYPGTASLQIRIPEFIKYSITYNTDETEVDIEGYNADEDYINNIIDNEKLTPTNKDIEEMLTGFMTNYFPYLALAIVFLYLARKIFKLFK